MNESIAEAMVPFPSVVAIAPKVCGSAQSPVGMSSSYPESASAAMFSTAREWLRIVKTAFSDHLIPIGIRWACRGGQWARQLFGSAYVAISCTLSRCTKWAIAILNHVVPAVLTERFIQSVNKILAFVLPSVLPAHAKGDLIVAFLFSAAFLLRRPQGASYWVKLRNITYTLGFYTAQACLYHFAVGENNVIISFLWTHCLIGASTLFIGLVAFEEGSKERIAVVGSVHAALGLLFKCCLFAEETAHRHQEKASACFSQLFDVTTQQEMQTEVEKLQEENRALKQELAELRLASDSRRDRHSMGLKEKDQQLMAANAERIVAEERHQAERIEAEERHQAEVKELKAEVKELKDELATLHSKSEETQKRHSAQMNSRIVELSMQVKDANDERIKSEETRRAESKDANDERIKSEETRRAELKDANDERIKSEERRRAELKEMMDEHIKIEERRRAELKKMKDELATARSELQKYGDRSM